MHKIYLYLSLLVMLCFSVAASAINFSPGLSAPSSLGITAQICDSCHTKVAAVRKSTLPSNIRPFSDKLLLGLQPIPVSYSEIKVTSIINSGLISSFPALANEANLALERISL